MGMVGCFRQISPWLFEQLISKQQLVEPFLLVGYGGLLEQTLPQVVAAVENDPFITEMARDMKNEIQVMVPEDADRIIQEASSPARISRQELAGNPPDSHWQIGTQR